MNEKDRLQANTLAKQDQFQAYARERTTVIDEWMESVKRMTLAIMKDTDYLAANVASLAFLDNQDCCPECHEGYMNLIGNGRYKVCSVCGYGEDTEFS